MDRLAKAKVAIFGIGGVGGYVAEALADEEGLSVTGMELAEKNGFLELRVLLRYENETGEAVVTIGGE